MTEENVPKKIAYLGPPGTYSEEATVRYDADAQITPYPSFSAVATAVTTGLADEGVVAIENALEGAVIDTLDLLIRGSGFSIRHEIVVPIAHCLLARPGTDASNVEVVYSHSNALGQCRTFIEQVFPKAEAIPSLSTAAAVEDMLASKRPAVAIAGRRTADLYDVEILVDDILKDNVNATRFVVLAKEDHPPTGDDKTSICLAFSDDKPGLLYTVLGEFARHDINLTKVESRPSKESLGRYVFLIDLEGHRNVSPVKDVLEAVEPHTSLFKIFGSYPRYHAPEHA